MSAPQVHVQHANSDAVKVSEKGSSDECREPNIASEHAPLRFLHRITALLAHYGVETHGYVRSFVLE